MVLLTPHDNTTEDFRTALFSTHRQPHRPRRTQYGGRSTLFSRDSARWRRAVAKVGPPSRTTPKPGSGVFQGARLCAWWDSSGILEDSHHNYVQPSRIRPHKPVDLPPPEDAISYASRLCDGISKPSFPIWLVSCLPESKEDLCFNCFENCEFSFLKKWARLRMSFNSAETRTLLTTIR